MKRKLSFFVEEDVARAIKAKAAVDCGHALRIFYQSHEYRDPLKPRIALVSG